MTETKLDRLGGGVRFVLNVVAVVAVAAGMAVGAAVMGALVFIMVQTVMGALVFIMVQTVAWLSRHLGSVL